MNTQASNALLKILEEPPDRTLLVLTANHPSNLLPTIVSRCRHLPFSPLENADIRRLLPPQQSLSPESLDAAIAMSKGSLTRAQKYTEPQWMNRRNRILRFLGELLSEKNPPTLRKWLAFSEMLSKKKDRVEESLEVVTMWFRDLLVISIAPARVINQDCLESLEKIAKTIRQIQVIELIEAVEEAKSALRSNTNTRLTLDAMALKLAATNNSYPAQA
jgi:DNA polymerase-3 subunit delta'